MRLLAAAYGCGLMLSLSRAAATTKARRRRATEGMLMGQSSVLSCANERAATSSMHTVVSASADDADIGKNVADAVRQLMLMVQAAHNGKLVITHDAFAGLLGVITSGWDVYALWQKQPTL
jgi:Flp pilus assembly protein TadD